jgi:hypothetical protein
VEDEVTDVSELKYPWAEFLEARAKMIAYWRAEGETWDRIARFLSCDPVQAQLIWMGTHEEMLRKLKDEKKASHSIAGMTGLGA